MSSSDSTARLLLAITCAAAIVGACNGSSRNVAGSPGHDSSGVTGFTLSDSQRARLKIVDVTMTSYTPVLQVTGTVAFNGDHSTQVISQMSGRVTHIVAQPGTEVKPGDLLAEVASPDFASAIADYRKADAAWRNASRIADRDEALFANDALARSDLDQARSDLSAAVADLDASVQQLKALGVDDSTVARLRDGRDSGIMVGAIRAPIAGTVVEKLVTPGQVLESGSTPAFTIADLSTTWIYANVFESDVATVSEGQPVEVFTDASPTPLRGTIDYVAAVVDPGSKAVSVRIVARNTPPVLRRDMLVRLRIFGKRPRQGIVVPAAAILRDAENLPYVYVVQKDGTFARRRIELGSHLDDHWVVSSGLEPGLQIVADGALFVDFAESQ